MLYLISTPIGNLGDISLRALEILKKVDLILAEDTRKSLPFLTHFEIKKTLLSFSGFSEKKRESEILSLLKEGKEIALISDAGTPTISDPGSRLVRSCQQEKIPVTSIPGACAFVTAFTLIGSDKRFQFFGFLPKEEGPLKRSIEEIYRYSGISIAYESPQRILKTLSLLPEKGVIHIARELTKRYEEVIQGKPQELIAYFEQKEPKGEFVLLIEPEGETQEEETLKALLLAKKLLLSGLSHKDAARISSETFQVSRRLLYQQLLSE